MALILTFDEFIYQNHIYYGIKDFPNFIKLKNLIKNFNKNEILMTDDIFKILYPDNQNSIEYQKKRFLQLLREYNLSYKQRNYVCDIKTNQQIKTSIKCLFLKPKDFMDALKLLDHDYNIYNLYYPKIISDYQIYINS